MVSAPLAVSLVHLPNWQNPHDPTRVLLEAIAALVGLPILVLAATYFLSRLLAGRIRGTLVAGGFQLNIAILLSRAVWLGVWALGILYILYLLGIGLTPITAFIGVVGLAAGLSLQQVLQNLVAGVYLLAEQPFTIHDNISVVGPAGLNHEGTVEDIQMRTTHLRNDDDELILVPNSAIFGGVVTNHSAVGGLVKHVTVTFPRTTELDAVRGQVLPLLKDIPSVLATPRPALRVEKAGKEDWTACLSFWVNDMNAGSDVVWALARAFPDATVNNGEAAT